MTGTERSDAPWERIEELLAGGDLVSLVDAVRALAPEDVPYTFERLDDEDRTATLAAVAEADADLAATLLGHLSEDATALLLEDLHPAQAAAIVDEMDSDEQTDVLALMDEEDQHAILAAMEPEEAEDARRRLAYPEDTAGGLMITEFLAYGRGRTATSVIADLRRHGDELSDFETRYLYVRDERERLVGVVPMRTLLLSTPGRTLGDLLVPEPRTVPPDAGLDHLEVLFEHVSFRAVPVVDADGRMLGVVQRSAVLEAVGERAQEDLLKFGGIVGGQELRSMPWGGRTARRLMFLLPNILLSYLAVSIIAIYEPVIERLTALAIFIPMVANLSGAAGNQAVAVSIRELSLGLVRPADLLRVGRKEVLVGLVNGLLIGALLAGLTLLTRGDEPVVAAAVGLAYAVNSVFAVLIGGGVPLLLTRLGVDPAMMSSPLLSTTTDMGAFFLTLSIAALFLHAAL